jgi:hypothetical protein
MVARDLRILFWGPGQRVDGITSSNRFREVTAMTNTGKCATPRTIEEVDKEYEAQLARCFEACAEEDIALANEGLGDYVRLLQEEETEDDEPCHSAG